MVVVVSLIPVVVVPHEAVVPVEVPVVESPAESAEEADTETESERNPGADSVEAGVPEPARVSDDRRPVNQPWIVGGHVDDVGARRLDHDRLALRDDFFLRGRLEVARLLSALAHRLDGVEHVLLLVHVRVAQRRRPGEVLVHVSQHRGKLRDCLDAGIPGLLIDSLGKLLALQIGVLLHPTLRFHDLNRIRGGREDLRNQRVRIERDGRHQLLQLLGSLAGHRLSLDRLRCLVSCRRPRFLDTCWHHGFLSCCGRVRAREQARDEERRCPRLHCLLLTPSEGELVLSIIAAAAFVRGPLNAGPGAASAGGAASVASKLTGDALGACTGSPAGNASAMSARNCALTRGSRAPPANATSAAGSAVISHADGSFIGRPAPHRCSRRAPPRFDRRAPRPRLRRAGAGTLRLRIGSCRSPFVLLMSKCRSAMRRTRPMGQTAAARATRCRGAPTCAEPSSGLRGASFALSGLSSDRGRSDWPRRDHCQTQVLLALEEGHPSGEGAHRGCCSRGGWAIDAIRRLSRARWPLPGELVPRAIRGGAESAEEGAQRSNCPPPQGAGSGIAPSWSASQPDISTLLETGHFYLGLTLSRKAFARGRGDMLRPCDPSSCSGSSGSACAPRSSRCRR